MSEAEIIERLTDIITRQAEIIRELHNSMIQLNAATSLEGAITELQKDINEIL